MTTRSKIHFFEYQITEICSIPGGRWWCDTQNRAQILHWLCSIEIIPWKPGFSTPVIPCKKVRYLMIPNRWDT